MNTKADRFYSGPVCTTLAFLGSFLFFQFAYPYHIMRREQMNLFLFDWDYIRQTYTGVGWLARFVSDFIDCQYNFLAYSGLIQDGD